MTNQVIPAEAVEAAHIPNAELHARGIRFCPGCQATRLHERSVGTVVYPEALTAAVAAFSEAHESAHKAWREQPDAQGGSLEQNLLAALEAAAPHMLADYLLTLAADVRARGDIGKDDGLESWDYLAWKAEQLRTAK